MSQNKILYLSYDGILEPLGYSQVFKYVEKLSKDFDISIVSFEKSANVKDTKNYEKVRESIQKKGINWIKHKYHHKPQVPSTIYDLIVLTKTMFIQRLFFGANIIHLRGYPLGIPLVFLNWLLNYKVIFDIRGFWVDEKVDRDGWSKSSIKYKFLKFIEKRLFKMSDKIVTLTEMSKKIIQNVHDVEDKKISVIRTCADKIKPSKTKRDEKINFGYLGSTGRAYNFRQTLLFFKKLKKSKEVGKIFIFTGDDHQKVQKEIRECGLQPDHYQISFVKSEEISIAFEKFDCLIFNLNINFSISASMPTKIGESLSSNTPVICNNFNDDIEEISNFCNACKVVDFQTSNFEEINDFLLNDSLNERCQNTYKKYFTLDSGVKEYKNIYLSL